MSEPTQKPITYILAAPFQTFTRKLPMLVEHHELAKLLNITPNLLTRMVNKGILPEPLCCGTQRFYNKQSVLESLNAKNKERKPAGCL